MNSPARPADTSLVSRCGTVRNALSWTRSAFKLGLILLIASLALAGAVRKTVLDLMVEGRFAEAQELIADNSAGARYAALLAAMTEPDAQKACALYRDVSADFPGTDCDSLAQERLLLALDAGISITGESEIAEPEAEFTETVIEPEETTPEPELEVEIPDATPETVVIEETLPEQSAKVDVAAKPQDLPQEERLKLSSVAKPKLSVPPIESVEKPAQASAEAPATTGITVEYKDESKEQTDIKQASAAPEQSIVTSEEQVTEPKTETTEDLALLETKSGVKPMPIETMPHDAEAVAKRSGDWFIQVGAFGNHDNALRLAAKLRSAGYPVVLVPRETNSGTLMQVRVGGYETRDAGKKIASELKAEYKVPAVLVTK